MDLAQILASAKTIAVYGMSRDESKTAHIIPVYMRSFGYQIIPINPVATEIAGLKVYATLAAVEEKIDILDIFRPSAEAVEIVQQAIERHQQRGDIKVIWLQEGIVSEVAKKMAEQAGITFIQDTCIYKAYLKSGLNQQVD
jgi:predicted CoA-binding protein